MIKKTILTAAALTMMSASAMAGGLLTNTNQNAAYVRQMSQDGIIDITGLYANPAGTAFLSNGWHLSLNSQTARQRRLVDTEFPLYVYNTNNNAKTHHFEGKAFAPVIPSFSLSYNKDKWSVNAHFGLIGGGGKCEFDQGLGSFEALYAGNIYSNVAKSIATQAAQGYAAQAIPQYMAAGMTLEQATEAVAAPAAAYGTQYAQTAMTDGTFGGYGLNAYMKGRSYTFGLQLGGTYKFMDNLAGYVGLRMQYATNNYTGYVKDVKYTVAGVTTDANSDLTLNADQNGFGAAPIIGLDYKLSKQWNFAARYEAPTVLKLKNKSQIVLPAGQDMPAALGQFADGAKVRQDIPGLLSLGVQYSPIEKVRLMAGFHEFFDKSAKAYGNSQKQLDHNTWEVNFGAEYDCCKWVTVSASYQKTGYGQSDAYMNDINFNLSNQMVGGGLRIHAAKCCTIDLGYMYTFYKDRTVTTATDAGAKNDAYRRKNWTAGLGVNLAF